MKRIQKSKVAKSGIKTVDFNELFNLKDLQQLQDLFSDSCGVASIITYPDGRPITKPSNFCKLCSDIIRNTEKGRINCLKSDSILGRKNADGPIVQTCLSGGLWDAGASITVGGIHVANWLIGQVRNEEIDEKRILEYADEIETDKAEFAKALKKVPVMSIEQFTKVSKMLFAFANELSEKAYKNLLLRQQIEDREQAEAELKRNEARLQSFISLLQNPDDSVQEFLDKALNESISLTDSKIGYIYYYDEAKKEFTLNSWSKNVMPECRIENPQKVYHLDKTGFWGEVIRQRKPIMLNDFKHPNPLKKGYPKGHITLTRFLSIPVFSNDQIVAVAGVANKESNYNQTDILQLSLLMDNVWKVISRKKAENALKENEKKFQNIFENAQEGIFQTSLDGHYISVNPALAKMYGYSSPEELIKSRSDISKEAYIDPKERDRFIKTITEHGFIKGYEYEVKDKNEKKIWFYEDAQVIKDEEGNIKYFEGFVVDITKRKNTELQLIESEERYKRITKGTTDYLYTVIVENGKAIETRHSEACFSVTGYTSEEFLSDPYLWINMVVPEERISVAGRFLQILEGKDLPAFEHRIIHKNGSIKWISDQAIPKYDAKGQLISYDGIIKDITDKKRVEETLRESEEKYRLIIKNSHDIIYTLTADGYFTFVSPAWTNLLGHPINEVSGASFAKFVHPDDLRNCLNWLANIIDTGERQEGIEYRVLHLNGNWFWHTSSAVPLKNNEGIVIGINGTARDITERKKVEEALIRNEERYRRFISQVSEGVYRFECDLPIPTNLPLEEQVDLIYDHMFIAESNAAFMKMYGIHNASDVIGKSHIDFHGGRNNNVNRDLLRKFVADGYKIESGITIESNFEGKKMYISNNSLGIIEKGFLVRMWGTQIDITETKESEERLKESEKILKESQLIAGLGNYSLDITTGIWSSSVVLDSLFGIDKNYPHDFRGWVEIVHPDWQIEMDSYFVNDVLGKKQRFDKEYKIIRINDKSELWVHGLGELEFSESGVPIKMIGTIMDISKHKKAEEEIKTSKILLEQSFEQSPIPMILVSMPDMIVRIANSACMKFLGTEGDPSHIGQSILDLSATWKEYDLNGNIGNLEDLPIVKCKKGIKTFGEERIIVNKKGVQRYELVYSSPIVDDSGNAIAAYLIMMDITNRKYAQEKLKESEEKLSTLFSSMTEMVVLHELVFNENDEVINYKITDCNTAYTNITGIKKEFAIGKLATEVYQLETPPYLKEFSTVALNGEPFEYNTYFAPMDKHFMISVVSPKKNHFATITTDVTAIQQIQEVITAKNKELENYLYVASHDLRSPLVNIQGFSQRLQKQTDAINTFVKDLKLDVETQLVLDKLTNEDIPKTLNFIFSNVTKMDTLINGLLQISRTGRIRMTINKIDMNLLMKTIASTFNFQIAELCAHVELGDLSDCYGDENQLNQLFSNIIGNAIKYRDNSRKLEIIIENTVSFNKVIYTIKDNGIGIAQRHLNRVWDIFYRVDSSSAETGEGIGLSLAKRITEKHKGKIWVESEVGVGSTFYIELQRKEFIE